MAWLGAAVMMPGSDAWDRSGKDTKFGTRKPRSKPVHRPSGKDQEWKTGFT